MADESEKLLLQQIRRWEDPGPPSWREPWWNYILIAGGIVMIVSDAVATGGISGAAGGFMLGVGICALVLVVPLSGRLRAAYRLVQRADAAHVYDED